MDELSIPVPSDENVVCPMEARVTSNASLNSDPTECVKTSFSNSAACSEKLKDLLHSQEFSSTESLIGSKANIFESIENGFKELSSTDDNKREESGTEFVPIESKKFELEDSSNIFSEFLPDCMTKNEEIDKENTIEIKNVELLPENETKEIANSSAGATSFEEIMKEDNSLNCEVDNIVNGAANAVETQNLDAKETTSADSPVAEIENSQDEIGRCVDFLKREMLKLILRTSKSKYRIKECQIHLEPVKEASEVEEQKEDSVLVIKQDVIQCADEDIEKTVRVGYKSYSKKLKKELTSEADIEYISVESPPASSTKSTAKSNDSIVVHQNIVCQQKKASTGNNAVSTLPASVAVTPGANDKNCKMVIQSLPQYLLRSIGESIRSFSRTDPHSKVPELIPVQTIIPYKETETTRKNNGYIVLTTGVVERSEPIYYLSKETTLQDVFGGSVFSVVSHALPSRLPIHGTPMKMPDIVVSPPTSPGHVATLRMTSVAAQSLLIAPGARASFPTASGAASPPKSDSSPQLSLLVVPSPKTSPEAFATQALSPTVVAQKQGTYRAFKSTPIQTTPMARKRGRPPGSAKNNERLSSFEGEELIAASPTSSDSDRLKGRKMEYSGHHKENGDQHCSCCAKKGVSHQDEPSMSKDVKVIKEIKPVNTMLDCDDCGKSYKAGTTHKCMKRKVAKIEEKAFSCPECDRSFSRKAHLSNHVRTHKVYINKTVKCVLCKERFKKGAEIRQHRKEFHPEIFNTCEICNRNFATQKLLDEHMRIHDENADDEYDGDDDDVAGIVRCVYCDGSFELRHYEAVHVQECSDNPNNNKSRTDGKVGVRMAKPVAIRSKPFHNDNCSSDDEDHYQQVEVLEEYLDDTDRQHSETSYYEPEASTSRKRNRMSSQSEFDDFSDHEQPKKQIKMKPTAYRSMPSETSPVREEENNSDTYIVSDLGENGTEYIDEEGSGTNYICLEEAEKGYGNVEEMMNDKFSSA